MPKEFDPTLHSGAWNSLRQYLWERRSSHRRRKLLMVYQEVAKPSWKLIHILQTLTKDLNGLWPRQAKKVSLNKKYIKYARNQF